MSAKALRIENRVAIPNCEVARSFFTRFMGLMGRKSLGEEEGILFPRCNSVHTFFMRFPIDVVLIDAFGKVVGVQESVRPWRLVLPKTGTRHVLELAPNRSRQVGIAKGTQLQIEGVWS